MRTRTKSPRFGAVRGYATPELSSPCVPSFHEPPDRGVSVYTGVALIEVFPAIAVVCVRTDLEEPGFCTHGGFDVWYWQNKNKLISSARHPGKVCLALSIADL